MSKHVVIAGGGIAGMTAATYLAEAGYRVTLCESKPELGGKAKSARTPEGNPTEHSLRIYSTNYKTLLAVMARIPIGDGRCLIDNLMCNNAVFGFKKGLVGKYFAPEPVVSPPPGTFTPPRRHLIFPVLRRALIFVIGFTRIGVPFRECLLFVRLHLRLMFRSPERIACELAGISYGEYLGMTKRSAPFRRYFTALPQIIVAAREESDAIPILRMMNRLIFHVAVRTHGFEYLETDRGMMLNGPTSERLLEPWARYLGSKGVEIRTSARVSDFEFADSLIRAVKLEDGSRIECDYAILALPYLFLRRACETTSLGQHVPHLSEPHRLRLESSSGIQFFLKDLPDPVPLQFRPGVPAIHLESPWSFVTVVQGEGLWKNVPLPAGTKYIFSATWSAFDAPGVVAGKPASACTVGEIYDETLAQCGFDRQWVTGWHLDPELQYMADKEYNKLKDSLPPHLAYEPVDGVRLINFAPLMIYQTGASTASPRIRTEVANLFLAGEATWSPDLTLFVPTMEKAASSGFLAARGVVAHADPAAAKSLTIPESETLPLEILRRIDTWFWKRRGRKNGVK